MVRCNQKIMRVSELKLYARYSSNNRSMISQCITIFVYIIISLPILSDAINRYYSYEISNDFNNDGPVRP